MNTERDKFLTEAMRECWHEKAMRTGIFYACDECGGRLLSLGNSPLRPSRSDFSAPEGFFKLWNWAIEQKWWSSRNNNLGRKGFCESIDNLHYNWLMRQDLIHPDRFANAIYEFLQRRK